MRKALVGAALVTSLFFANKDGFGQADSTHHDPHIGLGKRISLALQYNDLAKDMLEKEKNHESTCDVGLPTVAVVTPSSNPRTMSREEEQQRRKTIRRNTWNMILGRD
jgi:hypothetical protein